MIDAHVHVWRLGKHDCRWPTPDLGPLYRDHELAEFAEAAHAEGVTSAILVQTQESERDTEWLLSLAASPLVAGIVGWTDLKSPDILSRLAALGASGPLVGIRAMVEGRDPAWFDDPAVDVGCAALSTHSLAFDALVRPHHLPALDRLAERHPRLRIVVDHAAKPSIGNDVVGWRTALLPLAARANVVCKLSGLMTELADGQPSAAITSYIRIILDLFGPDRVLWGSDWPVLTARASYREWFTLAWAAVPDAHRQAVFGLNAAKVYGLPVSTEALA
jgi:L-fuconolactonase